MRRLPEHKPAQYLTARDIATELQVSLSTAHRLMREMVT